MARGRKTISTPELREKFLEGLVLGMNAAKAAERAGASIRSLYNWRDSDEEFKAEWQKCYRIGTDALEAEAQRRATSGVEEPVYYKGVVVGVTRKHSDTLLMFLLKARDPYRFCDSTRAAAIAKETAAIEAQKLDNSTVASSAAIAALERLAGEKAALAKNTKPEA